MRVKHNKKNLKHKDIENNTTTQYEEKYNDVILNDLVPEDRKEEFNIQENEHRPHKKAKKSGFKFNMGKKTKKNKKQQGQQEDIENTKGKTKKTKKNDELVEDNQQEVKKSKKLDQNNIINNMNQAK